MTSVVGLCGGGRFICSGAVFGNHRQRWWPGAAETKRDLRVLSSGASRTNHPDLETSPKRGSERGKRGPVTGQMSRGWPKVNRGEKSSRRGRARNHETIIRLAGWEEVALRSETRPN